MAACPHFHISAFHLPCWQHHTCPAVSCESHMHMIDSCTWLLYQQLLGRLLHLCWRAFFRFAGVVQQVLQLCAGIRLLCFVKSTFCCEVVRERLHWGCTMPHGLAKPAMCRLCL